MIYYIYVNNQLVSTQKSVNKVSQYMRVYHQALRGFSPKTIKRKIGDGEYNKGIIKIVRKQNYSNTRVIPKKLRIFNQINIGGEDLLIDYPKERFINFLNMDDFIKLIMDKIKNKGQDFLSRNRIKVIISGPLQFGVLNTIGTTFLNFNNLYEDLIARINNYLLEYDADDLEVRKVRIEYTQIDELQNIQIYKGNEKEERKLITDVFNMKINNKNNFINFLSKHTIVSPNTTFNCFINACFIAKHKKRNIKNHVKLFISKFEKLDRTVEKLAPLLSVYLEVNIIVRFIDYNIKKLKYKFNDESKDINIVIHGTHAFALIESEKVNKQFEKQNKIEVPDYDAKDIKMIDWTIATYDLETCDKEYEINKKNNTIVYALGYFNGEKYKEIYKKYMDHNVLKEFINYLYYKEKSKKIIYAHNGGKFDTFMLLKEILISDKFFVESFLESNGRIINMQIRSTNEKYRKKFIFRDSINLIACSLDKACKDFKPKTVKLTGDVDHNKINIRNCFSKKIYNYTKEYLKNDCICLHEILHIFDKTFKKPYGFGVKESLTNAGIARRVFLDKHYQELDKPLYTLTQEVDKELRKYYYGGRNECMTKLGYNEGAFYYVDFTSLYPYVMKKNKYFYGEMNKIKLKENAKFDNEWFGFVKVLFRNTNKESIPLHGVLHNNKLVFPHVDNWTESIISTEEIKYSIDNNLGYEYKFLEVFNWNKKDYIFEGIIDELYKMKLDAQVDANKALRSIAKIVINSTYGFFGINYLQRDQTIIVKERSKDDEDKKPEQKRLCRFNGYLLKQKLKAYHKYGDYDVYKLEDSIDASCANVAIASMVTSYARLKLYKILKAIKEEGGNIYYMDTDSVITDLNIYENDKFKSFIGSGGENLGELTNEALDEYEDEIKGLYMDKVKKDNPKIKDKEKLNKIYKKLYKKKVDDYMKKTYKKLCCEEDDEKKKTPHYKELITLGNKMYALNTDFEYEFEGKKKILNTKIIKMKGVNSKQKYDYKTIDHENKKVYFKSINKLTGSKKIDFDDYKLLANGYELVVDNMNFITGVKEMIIKDKYLVKQRNTKTIKLLYDKANVNNNLISPKVI